MSASWSGEDWEEYCHQLLAVRHGANYQRVPDTVRGDWGIEGFTSAGLVYQCYAAEEPLTSADLYAKQRDKTSADLRKLRANLTKIGPLVAPSSIECWVLLVPRVEDKEILAHCATKAAQLRAAGHPQVSASFAIRVMTAESFPLERRSLGGSPPPLLPKLVVSHDEIVEPLDVGPEKLAALDRKLSKLVLGSDNDQRNELRGEILRNYVMGKQRDDTIRDLHPTLWERWNHERVGVQRELAYDRLTSSEKPATQVGDIRKKLVVGADDSIPSLPRSDSSLLADGTIADWLIECPLDFEGEAP